MNLGSFLSWSRCGLVTLLGLFVTSISSASLMINVVPSLGPNGLGSPSFNGYRDNAINELQGIATTGVRGTPDFDPTAYSDTVVTGAVLINPREVIATGFPSWRGNSTPTANWDGPAGQFASEVGNRIYFGVSIETDSTMNIASGGGIRLNDLSLEKCWLDVGGGVSTLIDNPVTTFSFSGSDYTANRVGLLYGADMAPGGGDDTLVTSGPGTTLVDAIYYVGASDALVFGTNFPFDGMLSNQQNLDNLVTGFLDPAHPQQRLKTNYSIDMGGLTFIGGTTVTFLPEPNGMLVFCLGTAFLALRTRKRRVA